MILNMFGAAWKHYLFGFKEIVLLMIVTRNRKIVWKQGHLNRNVYVMLKFTERRKTPRIALEKHGFL